FEARPGLWRNSGRRTSIRLSRADCTDNKVESRQASRTVARHTSNSSSGEAHVIVMHSLAYRAPTRMARRQFLGVAATVAAMLPARSLWAEVTGTPVVPSEVAAVSADGKPISLTAAEVTELRAALKG